MTTAQQVLVAEEGTIRTIFGKAPRFKHIVTRSVRLASGDRALIAHIVCGFTGHRRSVASARRIGGLWRSRCKRCGAEIVRVRPDKWRRRAKADLLMLRAELLRHLGQRYDLRR